jgi:hypothetical protein
MNKSWGTGLQLISSLMQIPYEMKQIEEQKKIQADDKQFTDLMRAAQIKQMNDQSDKQAKIKEIMGRMMNTGTAKLPFTGMNQPDPNYSAFGPPSAGAQQDLARQYLALVAPEKLAENMLPPSQTDVLKYGDKPLSAEEKLLKIAQANNENAQSKLYEAQKILATKKQTSFKELDLKDKAGIRAIYDNYVADYEKNNSLMSLMPGYVAPTKLSWEDWLRNVENIGGEGGTTKVSSPETASPYDKYKKK